MVIVRQFSASGSLLTCMRAPERACSSRMFSPPRPMTTPHREPCATISSVWAPGGLEAAPPPAIRSFSASSTSLSMCTAPATADAEPETEMARGSFCSFSMTMRAWLTRWSSAIFAPCAPMTAPT
eukprot:scaffold54969_cov60-Phaeocystis_antarctica.AAC.1